MTQIVMTKIFFDTKFTGLHQDATLISIGLIAETGETFYAEFGDYDYLSVDAGVQENVLANLKFRLKSGKGWCNSSTQKAGTHEANTEVYGNTEIISECLAGWLSQFGTVEMWSDCLAYDWVLFCQLWGHASKVPECVYNIPFDICTVFKIKGIDPDVNREEFAGMTEGVEKHNALWDARVIKKCYQLLHG